MVQPSNNYPFALVANTNPAKVQPLNMDNILERLFPNSAVKVPETSIPEYHNYIASTRSNPRIYSILANPAPPNTEPRYQVRVGLIPGVSIACDITCGYLNKTVGQPHSVYVQVQPIDKDGNVTYTNGDSVYLLKGSVSPETVLKQIQQFILNNGYISEQQSPSILFQRLKPVEKHQPVNLPSYDRTSSVSSQHFELA